MESVYTYRSASLWLISAFLKPSNMYIFLASNTACVYGSSFDVFLDEYLPVVGVVEGVVDCLSCLAS